MAKIKFYKATSLPASPTSAHDGVWFVQEGANSYKHYVISGGNVYELFMPAPGAPLWGEIMGNISNQTDLQNALNLKANDDEVVKLTGDQTVGGTKTFSISPVVPSKSTAAGDNPTAIATEAQVFLKANDADVVKLTGNQTIAGTKTFSSNVPIPLTPTANAHATSKKYVDDADANLQQQIDNLVLAVDAGLKTPEPIDCSANPNYPASEPGDTYKVTVAGKIGGTSGVDVEVGDLIICTANNAGGTQAQVGQHFFIVQANIDQATETVVGFAKIATQALVDAGTNDDTIVTPKKLQKKLDDFESELGQTSDGKYVRYDNNTQGLTNTQKSNARENIGAADDSTVVKTSGNQTVGGTKTFSAYPILPTAMPTTDRQAASKKYVDDQIAAAALEWTTEDW